MRGIASQEKIIINNILKIRKIYRILFGPNLKLENLSENILIFDTKRILKKIVIIIKIIGFLKNKSACILLIRCAKFSGNFRLIGIAATKIANAGVGKPLKVSFWSVILKIPSLIAEKITIIKDKNGK